MCCFDNGYYLGGELIIIKSLLKNLINKTVFIATCLLAFQSVDVWANICDDVKYSLKNSMTDPDSKEEQAVYLDM